MKKDWPKKPNKTDLTMSRNIVHNLLLIFCFAALTISCIDNVNDLNNWGNDQAINDLSGNYHFLEEEGIKIFLPENFNRINNYDLKKYADSIGKNYDYSFKIHQPKEALYKDINSYIYVDKSKQSTYSITVLPQQKFVEADAKNLLTTIRGFQDKAIGNSKVVFKKQTAKFFDNRGVQIFKTVYKVENKTLKTESLHYSYFLSNKNHTVFVNLTSQEDEENFDLYLQKMIL